ncbi:MAG TPA: replicative DNA helicase [Candidatus Fimenecus excrementigallinarum]|uniref:Replicative DNA helicase n=1 Tax=Candidatus Fimenecus excrementigallinarum TaxID=2840816 RepID=A0A9D1IES2_9FIRM|nr:replicative DNA helicase [Candidatus Fimenecus excrementigallinarum]
MPMDNLMLERLQEPYSLEAEQAVLGCILMDSDCYDRVSGILRGADCFYIPQHREIYSLISERKLLNQKVDALIVAEALKSSGTYDDAGARNYLAQLAAAVPSVANVESYAKIVNDKYYLRTLMAAAGEMLKSAAEEEMPADAIMDAAEQRIYDIRQGTLKSGPVKLADIITNDVYDNLQKLSDPALADEYKGIPTGFSLLDKYMTGLNRSDLILIGARPAMGKTSFALNVARNVAVQAKKKVVFFSLEMGREQLAQRILSTEARVEGRKLRTGELSDDDWQRIAEATVNLSHAELYFDDTANITVPEMKSRIRKMRDVDCVVIDYLQLMTGSKRTESRVQEVSEITRSLKLMAKDLRIPVITCSQLSRSTEGRGKSHKPQLSDLRESGSIEQDADIVLMLYRESYYDSEKDETVVVDNDKAEVIIAKNRHGSTGSVDLHWNGTYTLFSTPELHYDA